MSINPNNYIGVSATIVGYAATDPRPPAYDKDGSRGVIQVPIAINEGYKPKDGDFVQTGTTWYNVEAGGSAADDLRAISKGDKIRIDDAKQEVREYESGGEKKLGITLKFGSVTILESKNGGSASYDDDTAPF